MTQIGQRDGSDGDPTSSTSSSYLACSFHRVCMSSATSDESASPSALTIPRALQSFYNGTRLRHLDFLRSTPALITCCSKQAHSTWSEGRVAAQKQQRSRRVCFLMRARAIHMHRHPGAAGGVGGGATEVRNEQQRQQPETADHGCCCCCCLRCLTTSRAKVYGGAPLALPLHS